MAITARSMDEAIWTYCYETAGTQGTRRRLPWAFVQMGTPGDARYVVPIPGRIRGNHVGNDLGGLPAMDGAYFEAAPETMPFLPFPLESSRAPRSNGPGDPNIGGPIALHFFGGV